jgi:hypothetical protein
MKATATILVLSLVVLSAGCSKPTEEPTTNKVTITELTPDSISHAKPLLPPGCATAECKGIKGHVSKLDQRLRSTSKHDAGQK